MAARVELGAGGELVGELEALVAEHPLREGLWASLVTRALPGRPAGRRARGLRPGAAAPASTSSASSPATALRSLEQQVLQQSPRPWSGHRPSVATSGQPARRRRAARRPRRGPGGRVRAAPRFTAGDGDRRRPGSARPGSRSRWRALTSTRAASGWCGSTPSTPSADLAAGGGRDAARAGRDAGLLERLSGADDPVGARQLRAPGGGRGGPRWRGAARRGAVRCVVLATSQVPLGLDEEHGSTLLEPLDARTRRSQLFARRARELRSRFATRRRHGRGRRPVCRALDGLPLAIELAAARVRSLSVQDIARRLDDRFALLQRPEQPRARAYAGAPSRGDRLELRPAVPRRPARALGAVRASRAAPRSTRSSTCSWRSTCRPAPVLDTVGRLVDRSLVTRRQPVSGGARYRLLDSIRAFAAERLSRGRARRGGGRARTPRGSPTWPTWCDAHVRGARAARVPRVRASRAGQRRRGAGLVRRARSPLGVGSRSASAGPGSCSATARPARRGSATPSRTTRPAATEGRRRCCSPAGWRPPPVTSVLAQADLDGAPRSLVGAGGRRRPARRRRPAPRVPRDPAGSPRRGARQRREPARRGHRPRGLAWRTAAQPAAGGVRLAHARRHRGGRPRRDRGPRPGAAARATRGAWCTPRRCSAGSPRPSTGSPTPPARWPARPTSRRRMGFLGQAALHRASLGRVQQRRGRPGGRGDVPPGDRRGRGRRRRPAGRDRPAAPGPVAARRRRRRGGARPAGAERPVVRRGRRRRLRPAHPVHAGGGPRRRGQPARRCWPRPDGGHVEVQVFALDALARLAASTDRTAAANLLSEADALAPQVAHVVDEADRYDAAVARQRLR